MSKLKELKLTLRLEWARRELKAAMVDFTAQLKAFKLAEPTLERAVADAENVQAACLTGIVSASKAADVVLAAANAMKRSAALKESVDNAHARYEAALSNLQSLLSQAKAAHQVPLR